MPRPQRARPGRQPTKTADSRVGHAPGEPFASLLGAATPYVKRAARRFAPHADPDDVVQTVMLQAWSKQDTYDPERGTVTAWLIGITIDKARASRKLEARVESVVDHRAVLPDKSLDTRDVTTDLLVREALTRLSPRQRTAVELFYFVDLTIADCAAAMACSEGTVKSTLFDARKALAEQLGDAL